MTDRECPIWLKAEMVRALRVLCFVSLVLPLTILMEACSGAQSTRSNSSAPSYEGSVDIVNCQMIAAWGWNRNSPNDVVALDVYDGNTLLNTATADVFRPNLLTAGKGNGKHSITWPVPVQLKDRNKHDLVIKFHGTDIVLPRQTSAPASITCNLDADPSAYEGYVDGINCQQIVAWGWDINRPNDAVTFDFYDGKSLVGTATASAFRQDLVDAGKGNGKHNVTWPVPVKLKDGKKHDIIIKFHGTEIELSRPLSNPPSITCNQ